MHCRPLAASSVATYMTYRPATWTTAGAQVIEIVGAAHRGRAGRASGAARQCTRSVDVAAGTLERQSVVPNR